MLICFFVNPVSSLRCRLYLFLFRRLQVFTSASTAAFKTFACDNDVGEGQSYLRADYSLSCQSDLHIFFQAYAGVMILVSSLAPLCLQGYTYEVFIALGIKQPKRRENVISLPDEFCMGEFIQNSFDSLSIPLCFTRHCWYDFVGACHVDRSSASLLCMICLL